eukprot:gene6123-4398_t
MDVHIDELLKEYDDYVSSNPRNNVVNAKGKAWCSTLLKELRKSKKDVANVSLMKRKVCIKKIQRDIPGVIEGINDIVKKFPSDAASWQELGELYLSLSDNLAAVHCFEELVLLEPRNNSYHTRLAEALYSAEKLGELVERENGVVGEQGPIATVESMLIVK